MTNRLKLNMLNDLDDSISTPKYLRRQITAGILHFGIGNFHRAHQAVYLNDLFSLGHAHDWGIIGASVREADMHIQQKLASQDWLSTVVERENDEMSASITGAMIDYIVPGDTDGILSTLSNPEIRIVSMTITEGGYYIDAASGKFNLDDPDIVWDSQNIDTPKTVFGLILAGLMMRREQNIVPFTVMSCDNLPGNGHVTADAVIGLAELVSSELAEWVKKSVAFPNGMVDRITPGTTEKECKLVETEFGIQDNWPVVCEPFRQWVLEDNFTAGRPELEKVGVTFVDNVEPYEAMKLSILNGGHAAIAYPAALMDIKMVDQAMSQPLISLYLSKLQNEEVIPSVPPIDGVDFAEYFEQVKNRFSNPSVGDTIKRLCFDGSNRQPKFILPSVSNNLKAKTKVKGLALVSAFWCRYCAGFTETGIRLLPNDPIWDRLQIAARAAKNDPKIFLQMDDIFGDLVNNRIYVEEFHNALKTIWIEGTEQTLKLYLSDRL